MDEDLRVAAGKLEADPGDEADGDLPNGGPGLADAQADVEAQVELAAAWRQRTRQQRVAKIDAGERRVVGIVDQPQTGAAADVDVHADREADHPAEHERVFREGEIKIESFAGRDPGGEQRWLGDDLRPGLLDTDEQSGPDEHDCGRDAGCEHTGTSLQASGLPPHRPLYWGRRRREQGQPPAGGPRAGRLVPAGGRGRSGPCGRFNASHFSSISLGRRWTRTA